MIRRLKPIRNITDSRLFDELDAEFKDLDQTLQRIEERLQVERDIDYKKALQLLISQFEYFKFEDIPNIRAFIRSQFDTEFKASETTFYAYWVVYNRLKNLRRVGRFTRKPDKDGLIRVGGAWYQPNVCMHQNKQGWMGTNYGRPVKVRAVYKTRLGFTKTDIIYTTPVMGRTELILPIPKPIDWWPSKLYPPPAIDQIKIVFHLKRVKTTLNGQLQYLEYREVIDGEESTKPTKWEDYRKNKWIQSMLNASSHHGC